MTTNTYTETYPLRPGVDYVGFSGEDVPAEALATALFDFLAGWAA